MKNAKALNNAGWYKASRNFAAELMASSKGVSRDAQQVLVSASQDFLDYVQGKKEDLPYYTGNLHDSIAAAVYSQGHVVRANYMPKEATRPQTAAGRKRIVGEEEAFRAVKSFKPSQRGIYATLFVAVPYAEGANLSGSMRRVFKGREFLTYNHHPGYLEWLEDSFTISMDSALRILRMSNGKDAMRNYGKFKAALKGNL